MSKSTAAMTDINEFQLLICDWSRRLRRLLLTSRPKKQLVNIKEIHCYQLISVITSVDLSYTAWYFIQAGPTRAQPGSTRGQPGFSLESSAGHSRRWGRVCIVCHVVHRTGAGAHAARRGGGGGRPPPSYSVAHEMLELARSVFA